MLTRSSQPLCVPAKNVSVDPSEDPAAMMLCEIQQFGYCDSDQSTRLIDQSFAGKVNLSVLRRSCEAWILKLSQPCYSTLVVVKQLTVEKLLACLAKRELLLELRQECSVRDVPLPSPCTPGRVKSFVDVISPTTRICLREVAIRIIHFLDAV